MADETEDRMSIVGNVYLERGEPVEIVAQWRGLPDWREAMEAAVGDADGAIVIAGVSTSRVKRNVLIRRADGTLVVRPMRGLRKPKGA